MEQQERETLASLFTSIQCQPERIEGPHDGNRLMTVVDRLRGDYNVAANRQIMLLERIEGHLATLARPSSRFVVETTGPDEYGVCECVSAIGDRTIGDHAVCGHGDTAEAAALDFDAKWEAGQ